MTDAATDLTLTVSRLIKADPKRIYDAWLDPKMLSRFMRPDADVTIPRASNDPRIGGRFDILMQAGDKQIPHAGTYLDLTPHERITFTWESPFSTDGSTVTVTITPEGAASRVTLTHVKFLSDEMRNNHEKGWGEILDALRAEFT
jgi:uncharacterized protein YndB with AHSA1/START domain